MRLFIAEKPAMGKTIASFLPGPRQPRDGYVEGPDWLVSWCVGHLLEQVPPEDYDPKFKSWSFDTLPIVPTEWKLKPSADKVDQVKTIKGLLARCDEVVNAGDIGREGQGIIDELLIALCNTKPVKRLLLPSLDEPTVKRELANLHDNTRFKPLYDAFLGRQRADWLIGMSMTRAYSVLGRQAGYGGVLSVGRVQTPTLAIVVRRDREIAQFVPKAFWTVQAQFADPARPDVPFWAKFSAQRTAGAASSDNASDEDDGDSSDEPTGDRFCDPAAAERVVADVNAAAQATVVRYERKPAKEPAVMPFELTGLQSTLNAKYGYSVTEVLQAAQSLYEKKAMSYPRTDCPWLATAQLADAPAVLAAVGRTVPELSGFAQQADPTLVSRAWNDARLGEHHGLIPTGTAPDWASLSPVEQAVYRAVSERYVAQFMPLCEVDKAVVEVEAAGHRFVARGRVVRVPGWRVLFGASETPADAPTLPQLQEGQAIGVNDAKADQGRTSAPPRFTQGTLLDAMRHVHRLVDDPEEKKKLRALDGIGRSATRAAIIETLLKRGFIVQNGKTISASELGKILVEALPSTLTDAGLTSRWEKLLDGIAEGRVPLPVFEAKMIETLHKLVDTARAAKLPPPPPGCEAKPRATDKPVPKDAKPCPKCGKGHLAQKIAKASGKTFLGCTAWPACDHKEWKR
ncbi:DNA topoisomerase 3 [Burkholderia pseudomallei]|uniref:DNA topoisomerase 3 n=1 Tax=Burkholderia pseudomallei TaxID=28450 RepID=UPI001AD691F7|nr:DNA topoisomerase 3 [Burkholderia pseudomallei]MBO7752342.1 DNA topoisomerase 3 [Burkholderia pseudomallei]